MEKRIIGIVGGGGRNADLIGGIVEPYHRGRFPLEGLVAFYDLADIETALQHSYDGSVVKPVLRMPA